MKNWMSYLPYVVLAVGAILLVGFMAWLKNSRGKEVRTKPMTAYKKMLEGMRDSTENQLRQLADGKLRLFRTSVTGEDVEVTQDQIRLLRSQLTELNRLIESGP
jgi:CTP-dependent riboflavin kinase